MIRNILIVEDNKEQADAICKILNELPRKLQIYCVANLEEAYKVINQTRIHLFLLDIILDNSNFSDVSGLNFAEDLRAYERYKYTPIIFITSLFDPKVYTYSQLHCYQYIEKPISVPRLRDTILSALDVPVVQDKDRNMYFRKEGIIYSKKINEIIYIESSRRKIRVHCINDKLEIPHKTCKEMLKELDSEIFIQCSRFAIVNRNFIEEIDYTNRYIKLRECNEKVDIGLRMMKEFRQRVENG